MILPNRDAVVNFTEVVLLVVLLAQPSIAYVYPEHRRITLISIRELNAERSSVLNTLWLDARKDYESRLSSLPADTSINEESNLVDFGAWPAIAGDHSCSSPELLNTVLHEDWILDVNRIGARLGRELDEAGENRHDRMNALRTSDFSLLDADVLMASRAGSNNAHFLLPRGTPDETLSTYVLNCLNEGADINGIAIYTWSHRSALAKAKQLRNGEFTDKERSALIRSMLADEAFAVHFLQDAFSSGHVAGSWGSASQRKGTHDKYNELGLEVRSWRGESFVLLGDAWMMEPEAKRAALAVRESFEQLLDVVAGTLSPAITQSAVYDTLDVCKIDFVPANDLHDAFATVATHTIEETPMPGLASSRGELPRFNAELGPFLGLASAFDANFHHGGFIHNQEGMGFIGGIELALRLGVGLEGVLNESGDGLVFLDAGIARQSASTLTFLPVEELSELGAISSAIPAQSTILARLRMPFYAVPFDLLLAGPVLFFVSPATLTRMAVVAVNGSLLGWQSGIATSFGRFQLIAGREIGVHFSNLSKSNQRSFAYNDTGELLLLDIHSVRLTFPVLDYRNLHTFSRDQSSAVHIQFYAGLDIPTNVQVVNLPNVTPPNNGVIWSFGIRASLDWRYYFW